MPADFLFSDLVVRVLVDHIEEGLEVFWSLHGQNLADDLDREIDSVNRDGVEWLAVWETPLAAVAEGLPWHSHWFID